VPDRWTRAEFSFLRRTSRNEHPDRLAALCRGDEERASPRPGNRTNQVNLGLATRLSLLLDYFPQPPRHSARQESSSGGVVLPGSSPSLSRWFFFSLAARAAVRERDAVTQERKEKKRRETRGARRTGFKRRREARNVH